jgi:protein-tyrosine phosphatase
MPEHLYPIEAELHGKLAVASRPRGNDWLEDDLSRWFVSGASQIVSLLEPDEIRHLELEQEQDLVERLGLTFRSFPIPDRGVPTDIEAFAELVGQLHDELQQGQRIIIHCRQGIGRSGLLAASVLRSFKYSWHEALDIVSIARGIRVPETEEQRQWLVRNMSLLQEQPAA